jgi:hypothetical protein
LSAEEVSSAKKYLVSLWSRLKSFSKKEEPTTESAKNDDIVDALELILWNSDHQQQLLFAEENIEHLLECYGKAVEG